MLQYLLQTVFFQLVFLLVFELLLKNETFFSHNRWYLLLTPILALLLPLMNIQGLSELFPEETFVLLPEVVLDQAAASGGVAEGIAPAPSGSSASVFWMPYAACCSS